MAQDDAGERAAVEAEDRRTLDALRANVAAEVDERIADSLFNEVRIALGRERAADAVATPWARELESPERPAEPVPAARSTTDVFDASAGQLLILGDTGAGKTVELLHLAGPTLAGLRQALAEHPDLAALADTPLMLNVMSLTYRDRARAAVTACGPAALFDAYLDRVFHRKTGAGPTRNPPSVSDRSRTAAGPRPRPAAGSPGWPGRCSGAGGPSFRSRTCSRIG